jgi:hypothetical protein
MADFPPVKDQSLDLARLRTAVESLQKKVENKELEFLGIDRVKNTAEIKNMELEFLEKYVRLFKKVYTDLKNLNREKLKQVKEQKKLETFLEEIQALMDSFAEAKKQVQAEGPSGIEFRALLGNQIGILLNQVEMLVDYEDNSKELEVFNLEMEQENKIVSMLQ